jgi:hypothetical protein
VTPPSLLPTAPLANLCDWNGSDACGFRFSAHQASPLLD